MANSQHSTRVPVHMVHPIVKRELLPTEEPSLFQVDVIENMLEFGDPPGAFTSTTPVKLEVTETDKSMQDELD